MYRRAPDAPPRILARGSCPALSLPCGRPGLQASACEVSTSNLDKWMSHRRTVANTRAELCGHLPIRLDARRWRMWPQGSPRSRRRTSCHGSTAGQGVACPLHVTPSASSAVGLELGQDRHAVWLPCKRRASVAALLKTCGGAGTTTKATNSEIKSTEREGARQCQIWRRGGTKALRTSSKRRCNGLLAGASC